MISKRLFRGPWLWIVIIAAIVIGVLLTSGSDGSREIRTATMVTYLDDNKINIAGARGAGLQAELFPQDGGVRALAPLLSRYRPAPGLAVRAGVA